MDVFLPLVDGLAPLTQLTVFVQSHSLIHKHMFVFLFDLKIFC